MKEGALMARRIGAMFGMVLIVGMTLFLMWRVYIHHKQAGGEDDEPSVIARLSSVKNYA